MTIGFIGLGNMGGGMAVNLAKAGHVVRAFDPAFAYEVAAIVRSGIEAMFGHAQADEQAHQPRDLVKPQQVVAGHHGRAVGGHAVGAAEVAAVGDRHPQVVDMPGLQVDQPERIAAEPGQVAGDHGGHAAPSSTTSATAPCSAHSAAACSATSCSA